MYKRQEQAELTFAKAREEDRLGEWAWVQVREGGTVVLYALIIAFLIKTFLLRGFYIPSGSMEQTLQVNDRVFINVAGSYFNEPKRGDVIAVSYTHLDVYKRQATRSTRTARVCDGGVTHDFA